MTPLWRARLGPIAVAAVGLAAGPAPRPVAAAFPAAVPGEILVQWAQSPAAKAGAPDATAAPSLDRLEQRYGPARSEPLWPSRPAARPAGGPARAAAEPLSRWARLRFDASVDGVQLAAEAARLPGVAQAQPNYLRTPCYTPDDPALARQWALSATGWLAAANPDARGIVVGVIDSGVEYDHPDLRDQIWTNGAEYGGADGVDDDGNGYVDDVVGWDFADAPGLAASGDYLERDADPRDESGHGTHVAGTIAACADNGLGIAGLAPNVRVMVLRAGFNAAGGGYLADDDVAAAVVYAVENGADILNLSFGDPHPAPVLRDVLAYAHAAGVTAVASAGNTGEWGVLYPARFSTVIAVGAVAESGQVTSFSSSGYEVDVAAPGYQIHSLSLDGGYADLSGTSMAAAHVSGLSALVLASDPGLGPLQVRAALAAAAQDVASRGWDPWTGHGLVMIRPPPPFLPAARFVRPVPGESVEGRAEIHLALADPASNYGRGATWSVAWVPAGESGWTELESPTAGPEGLLTWALPGLPPGEYALRAQAAYGTGPVERSQTFASFAVRERAPAISDLEWTRALAGDQWVELVEWSTDLPAGGLVRVAGAGAPGPVLSAPPGRTEHWVALPADLAPGTHQVEVDADGTGRHVGSISVEVPQRGLESLPGTVVGSLPAGYLLPELPDFDGDGRPEVAAMSASPYGYGTATLYEAGPSGAWTPVHTTAQTLIPWTTGDFDGDGLPELMAVDAERVRLLEAVAPGAFPDRVAWEQREVWGGAVGDVDGDGLVEMHLRSSRGALVRAYENRGDDRHDEVALLANPTAGANDLGERSVLADLDGDGAVEVLLGDVDGDLLVYGGAGDDAFRWEWSGAGPGGDARLVGGGVDLDGDGRVEVVAGGFAADAHDPSHSLWSVAVYEVSAAGQLRAEWQVPVLGGRATRNGIAVGDLDGDGLPELILGLPPNLYVLGSPAPDRYEPVWWAASDAPRRAVVGDVDGDGVTELVCAAREEIAVTRFAQLPGRLAAPTGFVAAAHSANRIDLTWEAVAGAAHYAVRRDGEVRADTVRGTAWSDGEVAAGVEHAYEVAALTLSGAPGLWTRAAVAQGETPPRIVGAEVLSPAVVAVRFDSAMGASAGEPHRYQLAGEGAGAHSAVLERDGRRAVIGFPSWPDSGAVLLVTAGLRSLRGTPLAPEWARVTVDPGAGAGRTRLASAVRQSSASILLRFTGPLDTGPGASPNAPGAVLIEGGALEIADVRPVADDELLVELGPASQPWVPGREYAVRVSGLRDAQGRRVEGYATIAVPADEVGPAIAYPNPYDPAAGGLVIAPLPAGSRVAITTLTGSEVWAAEAGPAGRVQWYGRNRAGRRVGAGIYLYYIAHSQGHRLGRVAVLGQGGASP